MSKVIKFIFFISMFGIFYVYVGYPLAVFLISKWRCRIVHKSPFEPSVTLIIAAYNEAEHIGQTVQNKLELDYPAAKLEIIVVSDESEDGTDEIVQQFSSAQVRLLRQQPRAGKTSALNLAVEQAAGEILVFSDANSLYATDALQHLLANFSDQTVGYVTGKMIYVNQDGSLVGDGCSAYMRYENILRDLETRIGSVVGVDGGIDAVRRSLYRPMRADQLPDFVLPLNVIDQEFRVVYEPAALLRESVLKDAGDEYRMRVRVSLRALWALWDMRRLLGLNHNRLFAWQLWSHKVLRYLCFVFMVGALVSNLLLVGQGSFYVISLLLQIVAYAGALLMPWLETKGYHWGLLNFARYFLLLNVASAHAFGKFICGKKQVLWTPRKG